MPRILMANRNEGIVITLSLCQSILLEQDLAINNNFFSLRI